MRVANLGDAGRDALERGLDGDVARHVAQPPGELVAGEHGVGDAAHHPVEQVDRQADAAHAAFLVSGSARGVSGSSAIAARLLAQRGDQRLVILAGQRFAGLERLDELADPVDHREHGADQRGVGGCGVPARTSASASSAAWLSCCSRGRSKKPQLPLTVWTKRKISSSRSRSLGCGFPRDDRARQRLQHVARFRDEVVDQLVHGSVRICADGLMGSRW